MKKIKGEQNIVRGSKEKVPHQKEIPLIDTFGQEYFDTHTHIDAILEKYKLPIDSFPQFKVSAKTGFLLALLLIIPQEANFKNGFGGCVTVCCEEASFEPARKLITFDNIYGAFGIHPHEVSLRCELKPFYLA